MNFWDKVFGQNPKDLFLEFSPLDSDWRIVSWNFDLKESGGRQRVIEAHRKDHKGSIQWEKSSHENLSFWKDGHLLRKRRLGTSQFKLRDLMNLAIHSTLKYSLETNHEFMVTPVSGATHLDIQNEVRALQWIQASFGMLTRALDKFESDPELILTASVFSGVVPETNENVLRLIAFNLDIFYYLRPDFTLQVVVFDDKNLGHGESKTPNYQQIIKVTKPQFYDEIVKLVHRLALVGEIK